MKKILITSLALMMILTIFAPSVFAAATDIQFYGYTWLRETGNNKVFGDNYTNTSKPSIERTYLRWKLKYEDNLEGNLTLDIPMKSGNTTNSDWTTLVKYAYVDMKNTLPEDGYVRLGVQPVYFAMLDRWEYPMAYKPLEDNLGLLSSADLGVSFNGTYLGGFGDYQIAAFGGNGYSKPTETDNNTATDISTTIYPFAGLSIRGSLYNSQVSSADTYAREGTQAGKIYNGVAVNYVAGPLWFMWEGIDGYKPNSLMFDNYKVAANSKMVMWTINDKWDAGLREDTYNPDVDNDIAGTATTANTTQHLLIYGLNYHWAEDLLIQMNYSRLTFDSEPSDLGAANPYTGAGTKLYTQYESIVQVKWSF
jgi:hypothetical protein